MINPENVYPYPPSDQTPKFVITKNRTEPNIEHNTTLEILFLILCGILKGQPPFSHLLLIILDSR